MRVLFVSRKSVKSFGGLSRFTQELIANFPKPYYLLSPDSLGALFKLPFLQIDLIHLCDATLLPVGILLKIILRKPLIVTAHGLDLTFPNPLYQQMLRIMLSHTDGIIVDSKSAPSLLLSYHLSDHKVHVIHPGISIRHFSHERTLLLRLSFKDEIVLVTVGNLVARKGHGWFIKEVLRNLKGNFIYLIVGDGPMKNKIGETIAKYNLEKAVYLLGNVPDVELAYILEKADIYVAPNQKMQGDFEGFGIAAGEAAAMGLPVIASNVDGLGEIIRDGKNGLLVKPDTSSFLGAIKTLTNKVERQNLGRKAKTYTRTHFSWEQTSKKYLTVFAKVIGKKKASPVLSFPM